MQDFFNLNLEELARGLKNKKFSSTELVTAFLDFCEKDIDAKEQGLNALIATTNELGQSMAKQADELIQTGNSSALTGIPIIHKDIFCLKDHITTGGSKILSNFISPYDASVVYLLKQQKMPVIARANMDEFAMGSTNENSFFGAVKNPWNKQHVAGGSSGGSAAAVAAGFVPIATGTDTGGSIRKPASFCGIAGIKPTYGSVSRYGIIAYASSFDQAGVFGKTSTDLAYGLNSLIVFDEKDSTSYKRDAVDFVAELKKFDSSTNNLVKDLKIGVPDEFFDNSLDSEVASAIKDTLNKLEQEGAKLVKLSLPNLELAVAAYYILASAEASANLARYDGVRYGHRCDNPTDLVDLYHKSRAQGFGKEVKKRIMLGSYVLSAGYYDAYYLKAQKVRTLIKNDFVKAFTGVDLILGPTSPTTAFKLGEAAKDSTQMYLADSYTIPVNLAGLPAASFPIGFDSKGLPIGIHVIGDYFQENKILQVGLALEGIYSDLARTVSNN